MNNNNNTVHRSSRAGRQSLFYRDLSSTSPPIRTAPYKNVYTTPGQAAAATALRRENFGGSDPPPPPIFTLEDRVDFSPEANVGDYPTAGTPETKTPARSSSTAASANANVTISNNNRLSLANAHPETTAAPILSHSLTQGLQGAQQNQNAGSSNWWPPGKDNTADGGDRGRTSAMSGVVQPQQSGGLLTLPPPREIVRPDIQSNNFSDRIADEEEWVTVFGFSPADTNLVLREFEKCGIILKHVPGPGDANWMHILYQNHYDAQKALQKNGMQINGILIVGVKPVDPLQRQALSNKTNCGFMILPPHSSGRALASTTSTKASSRPYYLQSNEGGQRSSGAIASPSKSTISKIVDLMFGI